MKCIDLNLSEVSLHIPAALTICGKWSGEIVVKVRWVCFPVMITVCYADQFHSLWLFNTGNTLSSLETTMHRYNKALEFWPCCILLQRSFSFGEILAEVSFHISPGLLTWGWCIAIHIFEGLHLTQLNILFAFIKVFYFYFKANLVLTTVRLSPCWLGIWSIV